MMHTYFYTLHCVFVVKYLVVCGFPASLFFPALFFIVDLMFVLCSACAIKISREDATHVLLHFIILFLIIFASL